MKIGQKEIGKGKPCFIIAEIGINHNNSLETAKKMIDSAKEAGCDAIKIQSYKTEHLYSKKAGKLDWKDNEKEYSYDIFKANKSFETPQEWDKTLSDYSRNKGLIFFASVFDKESADKQEKLGAPAFKIGSSEITNLPLLEHVAKKRKPMIISTGGARLEEIKEAVETVKKHNEKIVLMKCQLKYPTPIEKVNMNTLDTLKKEFPDTIIGYSDHTEGPVKAPVAAIMKGAKALEKHITLDRKMKGPDHFFALEPEQLKKMVKAIRATEEKIAKEKKAEVDEVLLGNPEIKAYDYEKYLREFIYRTIITTKGIKKGEQFSDANVRILRPGKIKRGLEPKMLPSILGKKAAKDIPEGKAVQEKDIAKE